MAQIPCQKQHSRVASCFPSWAGPLLLLVISFCFFQIPTADGKDIFYTGDKQDLKPLPHDVPRLWGRFPLHLYPHTENPSGMSGNTLTVQYDPDVAGSRDPLTIIGGLTKNISVAGNRVVMHNGHTWQIIGGYDYGQQISNEITVVDNVVVINDGIANVVTGGKSSGNLVRNNMVFINAGFINKAFGGISPYGQVLGNAVFITGGNIRSIVGGLGGKGLASNNAVYISGGRVQKVIGGASDNLASDNTVHISGESRLKFVTGGQSNRGTARGNSVYFNGLEALTVTGGYSKYHVAENNHVTIAGGVISQVTGGKSRGGNASGNTVSITGGHFVNHQTKGDFFPARIAGGETGYCTDAINNTVNISGKPVLNDTVIYGGYRTGNYHSHSDIFSGNTLNIAANGLTVKGIANFQHYNFYLPASPDDGAMLTVTDGNGFGASMNMENTTVQVFAQKNGKVLAKGRVITLIDSSTSGLSNMPKNHTSQSLHGHSLLYTFNLASQPNQFGGNQLTATVASVEPASWTNSYATSRIASLNFVNQGGEMAAGHGMRAALATANVNTDENEGKIVPFAAFSGGTSKYTTGSHSNIDGFSVMAGLALNNQPTSSGRFLLGIFFETGHGNYSSHNGFETARSVMGKGDVDYYGGGIMTRYSLTEGALQGLYAEGNLHAGRAEIDFRSQDLVNGTLGNTGYESSAAYYGAHFGLGHLCEINENISLDLSSHYLWSRLDSDDTTIAGDPIHFKEAESQRWRNGGRINFTVNDLFAPYVGAAYEYEFDGRQKASAYGVGLHSASVKGGTGIGEVGFSFKPYADSRFSVDLSAQGYTGKREGVSGAFQITAEF